MQVTDSGPALQARSICQKREVGSVDLRPIFQRIMMNLIRSITSHFQSGYKARKETFILKGKFVKSGDLMGDHF